MFHFTDNDWMVSTHRNANVSIFSCRGLVRCESVFAAVVGFAKTSRAGIHCLDLPFFACLTCTLEIEAGLIETKTQFRGPDIVAETMDPVAQQQ